jgi:hypothetical protein
MSGKGIHPSRQGDSRGTRRSKPKHLRRRDTAECFMYDFLEAMARCEKRFRIAFHSQKRNGGQLGVDDLLAPEKRFVLDFVSEFADMNRALHRVGGWR